MIHKYLAGLIDQFQLAGNTQALDVASRLAGWVDRRTRNLSYQHMQAILRTEFGGLPEALANLYVITGDPATLKPAERFYHARFLDPLAANIDPLEGAQCNVSTPKVTAALRLAEETGTRVLERGGQLLAHLDCPPLVRDRRHGHRRGLGTA